MRSPAVREDSRVFIMRARAGWDFLLLCNAFSSYFRSGRRPAIANRRRRGSGFVKIPRCLSNNGRGLLLEKSPLCGDFSMFYNIKISLFFEGSRLMDGRAAKKSGGTPVCGIPEWD